MSINIGIPLLKDASLYDLLREILRRAVDGTRKPFLVDDANQRILIGGTAASASPAKVEVTGGDVKIITPGYGIIIPNRAGTAYYRLIMENDGAISADPL